MPQLPDLDDLRCFDAAARLLRFRAAARASALTPAAFGQRIARLEHAVDTRLFERTTRQVRLTPAGLALLPYARACLEAAAACHRAARGDTDPAPVELTLGTRHELGLSYVVPELAPLAKAIPELTLHLYFGSGADLLLRVRSLEIDCCITSSRLADPALDALQLHEERYAFVASPALLARHPLKKAADAAAHVVLDMSVDLPLFRYWQDAEGGERLRFARVWRLGTIGAIRDLALAGQGVAVLPRYLVERDLKARKLVVVMPRVTPVHDHFRLVFRRDDPRRPIYERMAEHLTRAPLR
jgi:LysR family glycine cleavage system transcriptional activator